MTELTKATKELTEAIALFETSDFSSEEKINLIRMFRNENNLRLRNELLEILNKSKIAIPKLGNALYQAGFLYYTKNHSTDIDDLDAEKRQEDLCQDFSIFREVFAVMNFIYQVDNGGLAQWVDNGYCKDYPILSELSEKLNLEPLRYALEDLYYHLDHKAIKNTSRERSYWRKVRDLNSDEIEEIQCSRKELERIENQIPKHLESAFDEYLFECLGNFDAIINSYGVLSGISYDDYISKFDITTVNDNWKFIAAWFVAHPDDVA